MKPVQDFVVAKNTPGEHKLFLAFALILLNKFMENEPFFLHFLSRYKDCDATTTQRCDHRTIPNWVLLGTLKKKIVSTEGWNSWASDIIKRGFRFVQIGATKLWAIIPFLIQNSYFEKFQNAIGQYENIINLNEWENKDFTILKKYSSTHFLFWNTWKS